MNGWNNRLNAVNSKISNLERVNEIPVGRDQDTIEKQRQHIKVKRRGYNRASCVNIDEGDWVYTQEARSRVDEVHNEVID